MPTEEEWRDISTRLREPFDPREVDFRVQGRANEATGRAQVVAFVDARAVQDRLDAVVGAGNWSFDWTPLVIDKGEVMVAKGTLTVHGVSKSDAGSASNFEQSLGAVSHCFKRAAVHWGIGRYLYDLPGAWVAVEKGGRIPPETLAQLRARLPRPTTTGAGRGASDALEARRPAGHAGAAEATTPGTAAGAEADAGQGPATEAQLNTISRLCATLGRATPTDVGSFARARALIAELSGEFNRRRAAG